IALDDVDEAGLLQHLQMAAEIAVGEAAELLEISKGEPFRMRHQRSQQTEPRLLMDDAVEAVIGEWRGGQISLRHHGLRKRNTTARRAATGRSRRAVPWSRATARGFGWRSGAP